MYPTRAPLRTGRWVAFLGVTAVAVGIVGLAVTFVVDDPLLPHDDLKPPPRLALADEENAHWYLREGYRALDDPSYICDQFGNLSLSITDPEWGADGEYAPDLPGIGPCLERNAAALALLYQASRCRAYQGPEVLTVDQKTPHFPEYRELALFLGLHALWMRREKRWKEARESCLATISIGKLIGENPTDVLGALMGVALQSRGLHDLTVIATHREVPMKFLEDTLALLRRPGLTGLDFALGLRRDHRSMYRSIDVLLAQELAKAKGETIGRLFFYKRNRTLNRVAAIYRETISQAGHERYPGPAPERELPGIQALLLSGNAAGELLAEPLRAAFPLIVAKAYCPECQLRLTLLVLALRVHQLRHGASPENLDELVPAILPELPVDPYSGHAFRYRRDPVSLYSVGPNGNDDGGDRDDIGNWLPIGVAPGDD